MPRKKSYSAKKRGKAPNRRKTVQRKKTVKKNYTRKKPGPKEKNINKTPFKKREIKQFQNVKGMRDILPDEQGYWEKVKNVVEKNAEDYSYKRIDFPIVESRELFERGTGIGTDIVEKEMYKFKTRGGDDVCLRPEGTPSVVRSYIQHGMRTWPKPVKLFYMGPMYRHDRPQEGRYREFYQFGFEAIGEEDPIIDAQMVQLAIKIFNNLGFKKISLQINSIGCEECRPDYDKLLISYLKNRRSSLCMDCKKRLQKNPLRILDCKEDKCKQVVSQAPQTIDHLCDECKEHFTFLLECLDEMEIQYEINSFLVRGLDYYTKTVFEFWSEDDEYGTMSLGGGGRYDRLTKILGGKDAPAIGFASGVDRMIKKMKEMEIKIPEKKQPQVYLAQLGKLAKKKSLKIFSELQKNRITVAESFGKGNLRSQLKHANQLGINLVLIIGQREALDETIILKDMASGNQELFTFKKVIKEIKKRVKKS